MSSILKSSKVSGQLLLRDSLDSNVSAAITEITAGKCCASEAVKDAESRLEFEKILGYHKNNRAITTQKIRPKNTLSSVVENSDDDKLHTEPVQLNLQGQWNRWCDYIKLDLSWKNLLAIPQPFLSFCLGATYDTLPSLPNLYT